MSAELPASCGARYALVRPLASGGFGHVLLARHRDLDRLVAVKVLSAESLCDADARGRFEAEARITAALAHPGIVRVLDFDATAGAPWIAYEYLPGASLRARLEAGALDRGAALDAAAQVAAALGAAHAVGVLHRDVKPENVLEAADGSWRLADFGIAKWTQSGVQTATGVVMGTPTYIAPEVVRGEEPGPASDLYALGVMLFEMIAGAPPFAGTPLEVLRGHLDAAPPLDRVAGAGAAVRGLLGRLLSKHPAGRPASAAALAGELAGIVVDGPAARAATLPAARAVTRAVAPARVSHAGPSRALIAAALIAGALGLGAAAAWRRQHAPSEAERLHAEAEAEMARLEPLLKGVPAGSAGEREPARAAVALMRNLHHSGVDVVAIAPPESLLRLAAREMADEAARLAGREGDADRPEDEGLAPGAVPVDHPRFRELVALAIWVGPALLERDAHPRVQTTFAAAIRGLLDLAHRESGLAPLAEPLETAIDGWCRTLAGRWLAHRLLAQRHASREEWPEASDAADAAVTRFLARHRAEVDARPAEIGDPFQQLVMFAALLAEHAERQDRLDRLFDLAMPHVLPVVARRQPLIAMVAAQRARRDGTLQRLKTAEAEITRLLRAHAQFDVVKTAAWVAVNAELERYQWALGWLLPAPIAACMPLEIEARRGQLPFTLDDKALSGNRPGSAADRRQALYRVWRAVVPPFFETIDELDQRMRVLRLGINLLGDLALPRARALAAEVEQDVHRWTAWRPRSWLAHALAAAALTETGSFDAAHTEGTNALALYESELGIRAGGNPTIQAQQEWQKVLLLQVPCAVAARRPEWIDELRGRVARARKVGLALPVFSGWQSVEAEIDHEAKRLALK